MTFIQFEDDIDFPWIAAKKSEMRKPEIAKEEKIENRQFLNTTFFP